MHPSGIEQARIEGDRVGQGLLADQIEEEDLPAGQLEGHADSGEREDQHHLPELDHAEPDQEGEQEGEDHLDRLHGQDHRPGRDAIGQGPGEEPDQQAGHEVGGLHDAQEELGPGLFEDDPAHGRGLEPGADQADALADIVEPEPGMGERGERVGSAGGIDVPRRAVLGHQIAPEPRPASCAPELARDGKERSPS